MSICFSFVFSRRKNFAKFDSEAQWPWFKIDWIGPRAAAALELAAPLTEWAEKIAVSMPASFNWSFIQRPTVELDTDLWGLLAPINSWDSLSLFLWGLVASRYCSRQLTGQMALLSVEDRTEILWRAPDFAPS